MALTPRKQLGGIQAAFVAAKNFSFPNAPTAVITSALGTALSTAGNGGVAVDVQPSAAVDVHGVVTVGVNNYCHIQDYTTGLRLQDGSNNEVYGRVTEAGGVYTLSLYSLVNGVQTPYTMPAPRTINVYFPYRFKWVHFPVDALLSVTAEFINDDPTASFSKQQVVTELLTVTGLNTVTDLSLVPDNPANVVLLVNSQPIDSLGGVNAAFSTSGLAITWNPAKAEFPLVVGDRVVAQYTYTI